MKFILSYVIVLLILSANEVLSRRISKGKQIPEGSFSKTIQGDIPASNKMTSTLIVSPENEAVLPANFPFNVDVLVDNLATGFFSDPETKYNVVPQALSHGIIKGHTHVVIQRLDVDANQPPNSEKFVFFAALNEKAEKGRLSVPVIVHGTGLPPGRYRICTMSGSFSHQPLVMPIAKRGAQDDCIRITTSGEVNKSEKSQKVKTVDKPKKVKTVDKPKSN